MPKGVKIPTALRIALMRMPEVMCPLEICGFTIVSEREQRRTMAEWRQTGDVRKPVTPKDTHNWFLHCGYTTYGSHLQPWTT